MSGRPRATEDERLSVLMLMARAVQGWLRVTMVRGNRDNERICRKVLWHMDRFADFTKLREPGALADLANVQKRLRHFVHEAG